MFHEAAVQWHITKKGLVKFYFASHKTKLELQMLKLKTNLNMKNEKQNKISSNLLLLAVRFLNEISDRRRAKKMVAKLHTLPKESWIAIDRQFNVWEFPMEFREFMPRWWMKKRTIERAMAIISPLMKVVKNEFGNKEQLRFHNVFKGKMTNAEFEYWYENVSMSNGNRSEEAVKKYYERRRKVDELEWWKDEVFEKLSTVAGW